MKNPNRKEDWKDIFSLFRELVLTILKSGHNVVIDDVCIKEERFNKWKDVLSNYETLYIALKADLDTLEHREKARDRLIGLARSQFMVHDGKAYDLEFDNTINSVHNTMKSIILYLQSRAENQLHFISQ